MTFQFECFNEYLQFRKTVNPLILLAIGFIPSNYPKNMQPGLGENSIGYHGDSGRLYNGSGYGINFGPKCLVGDKIGCCLFDSHMSTSGYQTLFGMLGGALLTAVFIRNGKEIGAMNLPFKRNLKVHAAVGMHSSGDKVKVMLDAKRP